MILFLKTLNQKMYFDFRFGGLLISRAILFYATICFICTGCATVAGGSSQAVTITSEPPGAAIKITPGDIVATTPAKVELDRSHDYVASFEIPGYEKSSVRINRTIADSAYKNTYFPFVGIVGLVTDALTDAEFTLVPDPLHITLTRIDPDISKAVEPESSTPLAVKFFNRNEHKGRVYFQLDSGPVCKLDRGQFVSVSLPHKFYKLNVYHWDLFKFSDEYLVELDNSYAYVGIFSGIGSTNYSIYDDFPTVDYSFNEVDCSDEE